MLERASHVLTINLQIPAAAGESLTKPGPNVNQTL